jgi:hypothetical protein
MKYVEGLPDYSSSSSSSSPGYSSSYLTSLNGNVNKYQKIYGSGSINVQTVGDTTTISVNGLYSATWIPNVNTSSATYALYYDSPLLTFVDLSDSGYTSGNGSQFYVILPDISTVSVGSIYEIMVCNVNTIGSEVIVTSFTGEECGVLGSSPLGITASVTLRCVLCSNVPLSQNGNSDYNTLHDGNSWALTYPSNG